MPKEYTESCHDEEAEQPLHSIYHKLKQRKPAGRKKNWTDAQSKKKVVKTLEPLKEKDEVCSLDF